MSDEYGIFEAVDEAQGEVPGDFRTKEYQTTDYAKSLTVKKTIAPASSQLQELQELQNLPTITLSEGFDEGVEGEKKAVRVVIKGTEGESGEVAFAEPEKRKPSGGSMLGSAFSMKSRRKSSIFGGTDFSAFLDREKADEMGIIEGDVTPDVLQGWLRRCRRKFRNGITVAKVATNAKLVKRMVFVGAKPEYFEITSAKLFDVGYHMSDVKGIELGCNSQDFSNYFRLQPDRVPVHQKCCVVDVGKKISVIFKNESDRRDFMFLMRVEMSAIKARYQEIMRKFNERQKGLGLEPAPTSRRYSFRALAAGGKQNN